MIKVQISDKVSDVELTREVRVDILGRASENDLVSLLPPGDECVQIIHKVAERDNLRICVLVNLVVLGVVGPHHVLGLATVLQLVYVSL